MTHQQALDTMAAERFLLDEMTEAEKHEFEDHFFDCSECAEEVRRGELIRQEVRRGKSPPRRNAGLSLVASKRPVWQRPSVIVPWAVAATLALTAGYQSLVTVPGLRQASAPQSLSPVMLREATRGAVPVVKVSPQQPFVTLGVDVMTSAAQEVRYDLLDQAGATILSGLAPLPPSGAPLYLLIPADELGRQGRYTLVVREPDPSAATIGEYSFDIAR